MPSLEACEIQLGRVSLMCMHRGEGCPGEVYFYLRHRLGGEADCE